MSDDLSIPNPGYRGSRAGRYGTGQIRRRPGMDPDTRRLMLFAAGLGVVLIVLIGISTLMGHRSTEVPVVTADPRPIRVKPENPGGLKIDGAENDVFSGGTDTANSKLAPPPETPDAKALTSAADAPPAPVEAQVPSATTLPPPPIIKPTVVASEAAARVAPAAVAPVSVAPASATPAKSKAAAVADAHPAASDHPATVQLAAVTSEDAAHNEWQQLTKRMPELLNGRQPVFSRTERDGHVYWRVRTAGFADAAQARTFCDHVRAKGGGCSVADF